MKIDKETIGHISLGSQILGGGGGGNAKEGVEVAHRALAKGPIEILSIDEIIDKDGLIVTISGVGSPASKDAYYSDDAYDRILELIGQDLGEKIIGFIPCEMGGSSSFETFMPSVQSGIPIIDAPCDGRAHPLGIMGALGLQVIGKPFVQAAAGGKTSNNTYVELVVKGSIESASDLVRNSAAKAGGAVVVARNPVSKQWLQDASAKGAYAFAKNLGEIYDVDLDVNGRISRLISALNGEMVCTGTVFNYQIHTENALDNGYFNVIDNGKTHTMYFFNEYMALDVDGKRKNTFPDLMVTINPHTGNILSTADIKDGIDVVIISTSHKNIILGKGLMYRTPYKRVEDILKIDIIKYIEDILLD